jgi:murein DD-endopeptidase MepM/ murein hydrolase activator NlpD
MARIKYYYDTETCRYERVKTSKADVFVNLLGIVCLCVIFGGIMAVVYVSNVPSHKEITLEKENDELHLHFDDLNNKFSELQFALTDLQQRDDKMYRVVYETEPMVRGGIGGSERYSALLNADLEEEKLIVTANRTIDLLHRQIETQHKSYKTLFELAKDKTEMLGSIPAIQPIHNKDLRRFASGFGYRIHPIYKVRKMHTGVDFTAPTGTPIFSVGNGKVTKVEKSSRGYGWQVEINHGYNYITKYAHMSKIDVRVGQKVDRGFVIGEVGTTGTSTAPHLHYEVIYKGQKVNPVNYFFNDLSPAQFDEITKQASIENQSFDGM